VRVHRIVAVAGDRVSSPDGKLLVNGQPASESYLPRGSTTYNVAETTIPPHTVYVLGDNRGNSKDSRYCGPVPVRVVIGRVVFRVWPFSRLGGI
jgi:signal peptidase I